MEKKEVVDTNLYSRQIGTFGMETMGKLIQMKVCIYGIRGLGAEIAKNIILAGPKSVSILDDALVEINDLGGNFYLLEEHVGKVRRDQASIGKLKELNPYVTVDILHGSIVDNVNHFNVVVVTEVLPRKLVEKIDNACRKNKVGFIYSAALGVSGFAFVDFGSQHLVRDENGEELKMYIVRNIDKNGIVLIDDTLGGKLMLTDGDSVIFKEVLGMTQLNDGAPREIKYISPIAFSIGSTSKYGEYLGGGIVEQVHKPKYHSFKSLAEAFDSPYNKDIPPTPMDLAKFGRNELLHCALLGLHKFTTDHGVLPELNNEIHAQEILKITKEIYDNGKSKKIPWIENAQEWDDTVVLNFSLWARAEISPVCAFLGGVVAQEIVKYTGKYTPINPWIWFDFYETTANLKTPDRTLLKSRYDDQIAIFGQEMQEKLENLNIFMIGAGALGCEFLKNFALMGVSTEKGKMIVTDNDNIEVSNLNRQFLFRKDNVGHSKSKCASEAVKKMNSSFNCFDIQSRIGPENEHIFDELFWTNQDLVINAVDNVNARKYIDNMCTWFGRPMIDSGTLGTKAHVQMIVPHVTSCYNDSEDPKEEAIPMCTLHNFPAMIEHCIEWGRDHFNENFTDIIKDLQNFLTDEKAFLKNLSKEGSTQSQFEKLQRIKQLILLMNENNFTKCIEFAVEQFTDKFDHRIKQLLFNFPPDFINKDGSKFWSGSKRVPHAIVYDANDPLCLNFVACYSVLIAKTLGIDFNPSFDYIKEESEKIEIPEFLPKKIKIKLNDNDPEVGAHATQEEEKLFENLRIEITGYKNINRTKVKPEDFEKDDDTNYHIDFIHSCSNLRARNYTITECDRQKTKMIAGKIIPAIATTTAAITGIVSLQIYTLLQTNDISYMKNAFINLAISMFVLTEPQTKIETQDKAYDPILMSAIKAIPPKHSVWDKILIDGPMTFRQLIDFIKDKYDVELTQISCKQLIMYPSKDSTRLDSKIENVYAKLSTTPVPEKQRYLVLEFSGDTPDGTSAIMPLAQYNFKY